MAEHWILCAAPDVAVARKEWQEGMEALLRCGVLFTAIRILGFFVYAAAGGEEPVDVDAFLTKALEGGPVIASSGLSRYYALVPPSTARQWRDQSTECLAPRTLLGVPSVRRTTYEDGRSYWAVPMDSPAALCTPDLVDQLARFGQERWALDGAS
ncbi:hypothetical protein ACFYZJ_28350 [Streptomyces sp. NPDC001848]|uniref:hypothetical protein n=1 Tax=Streptomyces sp. NPDC001848 TaxID=3364618 RepID=UPI0036BEBC98